MYKIHNLCLNYTFFYMPFIVKIYCNKQYFMRESAPLFLSSFSIQIEESHLYEIL